MASIGNQLISTSFVVDTFSGTGSQTSFTGLTFSPASTAAIAVHVAGVYQAPSSYSLSGTTLNFNSAPAVGTSNIQVLHLGTGAAAGVPSDGSVTSDKIANGAIIPVDIAANTNTYFLTTDGSRVLWQAQTSLAIANTQVTGIKGVAQGGTGAASATAYAVQCGGTTSTGAHQSVASVGTSGQVLMSNGAGALPTFQTVSTKAFPTGTRMSFQQTAAPTGWTKDTTAALNDTAMRIVTGSVVNGGTVAFTTAFASQTPAGSVSITAVSGTAGATTLTTPQIPSHTHTVSPVFTSPPSGLSAPPSPISPTGAMASVTSGPTGGGLSHDHPFSFTSGTGSFTGTAINLAVKYYDFIIASID